MSTPGQSTLFTTFTELVTTTYRKHDKEVSDAVTKHNALFRRVNEKGRIRLEDGGLSIVTPLEYQENSTYQRYSGYDTLNVQASDVLTAAEFPWRQAAVNVAASGRELRTNSGESRIINFVKAKIRNAQNTFKNNISADIYSDGTASNQIGGLQSLIADAGTGTVGGISATTWTFWQNQVQSAAAPLQGGAAITPSATTIESLMLPLWIKLTRGADSPDLIVMDDTYFAMFEQSQTALKRYAADESGKGGMVSMKYKTADVFFDSSGGIPSAHGYFVNTDYLELVAHRDANMTMMDELRSVNQDAVVIPVLFMGNLVCSNRKFQGVMKA
jgi:hypothetical protein